MEFIARNLPFDAILAVLKYHLTLTYMTLWSRSSKPARGRDTTATTLDTSKPHILHIKSKRRRE
jgi:hypothetical protein